VYAYLCETEVLTRTFTRVYFKRFRYTYVLACQPAVMSNSNLFAN